MKRLIIILSTAALLINVQAVFAQSRRDPTPQEKAVMEKAKAAIVNLVSKFANSDWEMTGNTFEDEMDVSMNKDAHPGTAFTAHFHVIDNSNRFNTIIKPMIDRIEKLMQTQQYDSIQKIHEKLKTLTDINIDVELNSNVISYGSDATKMRNVVVKGASKSFIVGEDNNAPDRNGSFILAFGNWQNSKQDKDGGFYRFVFAHPPQTPYIENIVFEISGAKDRINEMLQKLDWSSLNQTLTL